MEALIFGKALRCGKNGGSAKNLVFTGRQLWFTRSAVRFSDLGFGFSFGFSSKILRNALFKTKAVSKILLLRKLENVVTQH